MDQKTRQAVAASLRAAASKIEAAGKPAKNAAKNTAVTYMYRDASNYKSGHRREVLQGLLKGDLKTKIMSLSGDGFIASQVGFKELAPELWEGKGPSEDDHVFSELVSVEDTPDAPTIPKTTMTAERFYVLLSRNRWDVAKAMDALGLDGFDD